MRIQVLSMLLAASLTTPALAVDEEETTTFLSDAWKRTLTAAELERSAAEEPAVWRQAIGDEAAAPGEATLVEFRQLFNARGKPSARAVELSGRLVEIVGFLTPPPSDDSPFLVFVGAPTAFCPYCEVVDETDHPPYVLVYHEEGIDRAGLRSRVRVRGIVQAEHQNEAFYGIHNDVRLLEAEVRRDQWRENPVRKSETPENFEAFLGVTSETVD